MFKKIKEKALNVYCNLKAKAMCNKGSVGIEYVALIVFIGLVVIAALTILGGKMSGAIQAAGNKIEQGLSGVGE